MSWSPLECKDIGGCPSLGPQPWNGNPSINSTLLCVPVAKITYKFSLRPIKRLLNWLGAPGWRVLRRKKRDEHPIKKKGSAVNAILGPVIKLIELIIEPSGQKTKTRNKQTVFCLYPKKSHDSLKNQRSSKRKSKTWKKIVQERWVCPLTRCKRLPPDSTLS